MACSFRFAHHGKHKFRYIRRQMVAQAVLQRTKAALDRVEGAVEEKARSIAATLTAIVEAEASGAIAHVSRLPAMQALQARAAGPPSGGKEAAAAIAGGSADVAAVGQAAAASSAQAEALVSEAERHAAAGLSAAAEGVGTAADLKEDMLSKGDAQLAADPEREGRGEARGAQGGRARARG